jgi:ERCC4-related helicase
VVVRDAEWLVRSVAQTRADGLMVKVIGTSQLVRDTEATFFTELDDVRPLRPEDTRLVADPTPGFRRSRLWLEALLRKTPVAVGDPRLATAGDHLLDPLGYQLLPAYQALQALRPRLLIADAVGLGKTLEIGILLSELIRRGRGDRILVVTPRHILEQFQLECWTRFAIPLVRLDSEGIQRVRQKIPPTRNPFTYYKRVIISIDTLKNEGRYGHHLEAVRWDAVVIDECHSLINSSTLNSKLGRRLAPRTDALILASATPHNGKPESFAALVSMLDPTAIADPRHYGADDIRPVYLRRHKESPDVKAEVGAQWAARLPPLPVRIPASPEEDAVFAELADTWLYPQAGRSPATGQGRVLFPWTLLKAYLSSHRALLETVEARRKTLAAREGADTDTTAEDDALARLAELASRIDDTNSAKLAALLSELRTVGVGAGSATRVVLFSERHATLRWLERALPAGLGLDATAVRVLHGGLADVRQQEIVEEFALADSPVRLLLTGDIASEGVNLHRQCHHLVHFDVPWSLITIEQRNGRIDRYGQLRPPEIRALLHVPSHSRLDGDLDVMAKLLAKEHRAHLAYGDSGSLMGLRVATDEEDRIKEALAAHRPLDEVVPDEPAAGGFDLLALLAGGRGATAVPTVAPPSLFADDMAFVDEALHEVFDDPDHELDIRRDETHGLLTLVPPADLTRRLEVLPQSYLADQKVTERLRLTTDADVANARLAAARQSGTTLWPDTVYLTPQHPVVEWLVDKVLVQLGRNEAPVLSGPVDEPLFLLQGVWSNQRGQATVVEWMAVDGLPRWPRVRPLAEVIGPAGLGPGMANPGATTELHPLQQLVPAAVDAGRNTLLEERAVLTERLTRRIEDHADRLRQWGERAGHLAAETDSVPLRRQRERDVERVIADTEALLTSLGTAGQPLVRVVAVIVPGDGR